MNNEIVFVCNSVNNKNVRANELNILRKVENKDYFEFGESENNIKKRFYKNEEALNEDFEKLLKIKEKLENKQEQEKEEVIEEKAEKVIEKIINEIVDIEEIEPKPNKVEIFKKAKGKGNNKKNIF